MYQGIVPILSGYFLLLVNYCSLGRYTKLYLLHLLLLPKYIPKGLTFDSALNKVFRISFSLNCFSSGLGRKVGRLSEAKKK